MRNVSGQFMNSSVFVQPFVLWSVASKQFQTLWDNLTKICKHSCKQDSMQNPLDWRYCIQRKPSAFSGNNMAEKDSGTHSLWSLCDNTWLVSSSVQCRGIWHFVASLTLRLSRAEIFNLLLLLLPPPPSLLLLLAVCHCIFRFLCHSFRSHFQIYFQSVFFLLRLHRVHFLGLWLVQCKLCDWRLLIKIENRKRKQLIINISTGHKFKRPIFI